MLKSLVILLLLLTLLHIGVAAPPGPILIPASIQVAPATSTIPLYKIKLSKELQEYTYVVCKRNSVDYELVLAMMWLESDFNESLISDTDDYGLMQINIVNHNDLREALGITDFLDGKQSIRCGVYMIKDLLKKYDVRHALLAYNNGEGGAAKLHKRGIYSTAYDRVILEKKEQLKSLKITDI